MEKHRRSSSEHIQKTSKTISMNVWIWTTLLRFGWLDWWEGSHRPLLFFVWPFFWWQKWLAIAMTWSVGLHGFVASQFYSTFLWILPDNGSEVAHDCFLQAHPWLLFRHAYFILFWWCCQCAYCFPIKNWKKKSIILRRPSASVYCNPVDVCLLAKDQIYQSHYYNKAIFRNCQFLIKILGLFHDGYNCTVHDH